MSEQLSMFGTVYHGPVVVKGMEDEWIVICPACSEMLGEVSNYCTIGTEFPPRILVDVSYKNTLKRIRGRKKPEDRHVPLTNEPTDTQMAAAQRAFPKAGTRRKGILDLIVSSQGLTDSEIEEITGLSHQSASASRNSLMNDGFIVDSGVRRQNVRGNPEIVWKAVK